MKLTIRLKLFLVFISLLLIFQIFFLIANAYFIDDIFIWGNKRSMLGMYTEFKDQLGKSIDEETLIHEMAFNNGGNIAVIDTDKSVILSTYTRFNSIRLTRILPNISFVISDIMSNAKQDTYFFITSSYVQNQKNLVFIGKLPNNRFFVVEKSMAIVYDNSRIAEKFFIVSGIITLIIGLIAVYFLSASLTRPIIQINEVVQDIANLKFEKKIKVKSKDEIGRLGSSINHISGKLSQVLGELLEANKKLTLDIEHERSMERMRRQFVSSVSHELKTPISMIQGYADGLKFNIAKSPEDVQYYCDVIVDESEKMGQLVKDLLDLSSYESGIFKIKKVDFDISQLIKETVDKYQITFDDKNIELALNLPETCIINADEFRMEQVINNFISNAEKHVNINGNINIRLKEDENSIHLSIFNTGSRIAPSDMDNIWNSFYKVESAKYGASTGTGLGLAIIRAIVELHEGGYGVSNADNGIEFWIEIPKK